mgnify:CR=1 FL=1
MRKKPQQQRAKIIVENILEAAQLCIAEQGLLQVTTPKISEKSGIDLESLEKEKKGVNDRLSNIKTLTTLYQAVTIVFTIGFLILACYFVVQIYPCLKTLFIEVIV